MNKTLYIIRGLPGSGKSTLGDQLATTTRMYNSFTNTWSTTHSYAADDWFTDKEGNYNFAPKDLSQAHEDCEARVRGAMMSDIERVCVCNTFSQAWEAEPYFKLCDQYGYTPMVIECQNQFGNVHDVPQEVIDRMILNWEFPISKT